MIWVILISIIILIVGVIITVELNCHFYYEQIIIITISFVSCLCLFLGINTYIERKNDCQFIIATSITEDNLFIDDLGNKINYLVISPDIDKNKPITITIYESSKLKKSMTKLFWFYETKIGKVTNVDLKEIENNE